MDLRFYADATALIALARIGRLDLLRLLPTPVLVTARVWDEVAADPPKPDVAALRQALAERLLIVVNEGNPQAFPQLDPGESTVLTAAAETRSAVLVDERKARSLIATDPHLKAAIPLVTGVVGLILVAKRQGYIHAVKPLLDDLVDQRFRLSPTLYRDALREAGEMEEPPG